MREIVSVQVGGFANFVGSHFWNFQDELLGLASDPHAEPVFRNQHTNMDVLYRTGETPRGDVSYTPRMVSLDFQGSLGSMSTCGTLYNESSPADSDVITWTGNVSTHASEPRKKNLFLQRLYEEEEESSTLMNGVNGGGKSSSQREIHDRDVVENLENVVKYWTDFSKVHYHPRSLYEFSGLWMDSQEFDNYGIGRDVFSGGEEINERIRFFVEECDHIQGFQFIVDDSGGFSAVAADLLETIADEYGNTPVLLYSVRSPVSFMNPISQKQTVSRDLHDAVSFSKLSSFCKLIVPIGLPSLSTSKAATFLSVKDEKPHHCSAVYAATLHSVSLPFRMEQLGPAADSRDISGSMDVNGLVQMLAGQSRENMVAIMDVAMPAPPLTGAQGNQTLLGNLHPLTPEISEDVADFHAVESITALGTFSAGVSRASVPEVNARVEAAYKRATSRPMFCHLSVAQCPLPIPLPFPSIFGASVGQQGELLGSPITGSSSRGSLDVHSIPLAARLRSSSAVLPFLENRLGKLHRYGIERGAPGAQLLRSWGFGQDELEDMGEMMSKMVVQLKPDSGMSSDSD
ncbi:protein misato homolog 1 [Morus notabilis]|nr:protein misato homolog 1 [Morus notabilis]